MEDIKRQVEESKSIDNYRFNQRREPVPVRPESAGSVPKRRFGYKLCERHQQEYRQYCSCCALEPNSGIDGKFSPITIKGEI